jgi:hypothetical protein
MPVYRVTPLAPAYVLLTGVALILIVGPVLAPRRRHWLTMAISALAGLSLFFIGNGYPRDVQLVHIPWSASAGVQASQSGLVQWLGVSTLVLRLPSFEPFLWVLMLALLAISLAEHGVVQQLSPLDQVLLFALTAAACGVLLTGTYFTLAVALFVFDGTAAVFVLIAGRPEQAMGRLLLGVLSSAAVIGLAQGADYLVAQPDELGTLFSLTIWLRLGLYPLVESQGSLDLLPPMRLGWGIVNLAVGLYLVSANASPWLLWLVGATAMLHGALAWLEPSRERALAHTSYALAGSILMMAGTVGDGPSVVAASLSTLAALITLGLTSPRLGRPEPTSLRRLLPYLPPMLATASLVGVPFTLGWEGRGVLYQAIWEAGQPGVLALVVVVEGSALSVLYRYWRRLLRSAPTEAQTLSHSDEFLTEDQGSRSPEGPQSPQIADGEYGQDGSRIWRLLGATLSSIPFLIPVLGPRLLSSVAHSALPAAVLSPFPLSASLGLVGSLLWAIFLGYGRRRLLASLPASRYALMNVLRVGWLLRGLGYALDMLGRILLRTRAVIEGEHYLGWAILLALGATLVILVR